MKSFFNYYLTFAGRATRKEFWLFNLFFVIFTTAVAIMNFSLAFKGGNNLILFLSVMFFILMVYLLIDVIIRRLHDIGKSGWYYFIGLYPIVGPLFLIYTFCKDSQKKDNKYGSSPKYTKQT